MGIAVLWGAAVVLHKRLRSVLFGESSEQNAPKPAFSEECPHASGLIRDASTLARKEPADIENSLLALHPDLLDELERWYEALRPVDEEDIRYRDEYADLPPPPRLSPTERRVTEITAKGFTSNIVNNGLHDALNLEVLYSGAPDPSTLEGKASGGYADIYGIKLAEPRTFLVDTCEEDGSIREVVWVIQKIAVKLDRIQNFHDAEYKYCARTVREARIWCRMKHRNITPLLGLWNDFDTTRPLHAFVCPWFEEGDLRTYMERQKLSKPQKLTFLRDIASALNYMHNHEFHAVHGDLRTNNVLVKGNRAYISDFGLSRLYDTVQGFTRTVEKASSSHYIAPERFQDAKATTYSDVYEFGSVLWEVWTEKAPWYDVSSTKLYNEVPAGERPPIPDDMHSDLQKMLNMCWAHSRLDRPRIGDVLECISRVLEETIHFDD